MSITQLLGDQTRNNVPHTSLVELLQWVALKDHLEGLDHLDRCPPEERVKILDFLGRDSSVGMVFSMETLVAQCSDVISMLVNDMVKCN